MKRAQKVWVYTRTWELGNNIRTNTFSYLEPCSEQMGKKISPVRSHSFLQYFAYCSVRDARCCTVCIECSWPRVQGRRCATEKIPALVLSSPWRVFSNWQRSNGTTWCRHRAPHSLFHPSMGLSGRVACHPCPRLQAVHLYAFPTKNRVGRHHGIWSRQTLPAEEISP